MWEWKSWKANWKNFFSLWKKNNFKKILTFVSLTLREKDLNKNEYLKLIEEIYPIWSKYKINLILHQN